jgi:hypothetical protein
MIHSSAAPTEILGCDSVVDWLDTLLHGQGSVVPFVWLDHAQSATSLAAASIVGPASRGTKHSSAPGWEAE